MTPPLRSAIGEKVTRVQAALLTFAALPWGTGALPAVGYCDCDNGAPNLALQDAGHDATNNKSVEAAEFAHAALDARHC